MLIAKSTLHAFCVFALITASVLAQGSLKKFDHPKSGIRFRYPSEFKAIPLKPTEWVILAKLARKKPFRQKNKERGRRPEQLWVVSMPNQSTGNDQEAVTSFDDIVEKQNEINNLDQLLARRGDFRGWKKEVLDKSKKGLKKGEAEFNLLFRGRQNQRRRGYAYTRNIPGWTIGVIGFYDSQVEKSFRKAFRKVGRSIAKPTGYGGVKNRAKDHYRGKDFRGIPFRVKRRGQMVKGWKAYDTTNFFVVYNTDNVGLMRKITNDLESIRPLFQKLFPPLSQIESVSVVRICRDLKEYMNYGGPPGSAGYWNFVDQELVLFDQTKVKRRGRDGKIKKGKRRDSYITLYHEAFHQYIFYALGELSPDYWFNEGNADYFSGVTIYANSSRVKEIGPNPWRIPTIAATVLDDKKRIKLKELIEAKRPTFYGPRMGLFYAYGWSLCYFLRVESENVGHPEWKEIIPRYYAELKKAHSKIVAPLPPETPLGKKQMAQATACAMANAAAFKEIDLAVMESKWIDWMVGMTEKVRKDQAKAREKAAKRRR